MGRKSTYSIGQLFGNLEVLEIIPSNEQGKHVKMNCLCHYCGKEKIMNGATIKRRNSCGCKQRESSEWKHVGPKNKPWQLDSGVSAKNNIEYQYKRSAKKRNLQYELTIEEFNELIIGACVYCGQSKTQTARGQGKTSGDFLYTGIDRIDSTLGYIKYNCVSCCWNCNDMKKNRNVEDFKRHITMIYNNFNKEKCDV